jgi:hypothetical protein
MYAVFGSIVSQLVEKCGEPYGSFPLGMMRYGAGGVAGLGSLCGAVNGAAATLALFVKDPEIQKRITRDLADWYQETELPLYVPKGKPDAAAMPRAVTRSLLCKDSIAAWIKVSGSASASRKRPERCRRLSADMARRTVELVNDIGSTPLDLREQQR